MTQQMHSAGPLPVINQKNPTMSDVLDLPWFRCFPAKLLTLLAAMGADEKLVFLMTLLRLYEMGGPINDDDRALSHRCGISPRRVSEARTRLFATGVLVWVGDGYTNPDAQQEIEIRSELVKEKSDLQSFRRRGGKKTLTNQSTTTTSGQPLVTTGQPQVTDLDRDIDKDSKREPRQTTRTHAVKMCLPDDWKPSEVDIAFAREQGLTDSEIKRDEIKFRNYFGTEHRVKRASWPKTWETWVLTTAGGKEGRRQSAPSRQPAEAGVVNAIGNAIVRSRHRGDDNVVNLDAHRVEAA
jgi:hypothetical protein